MIGLKQKWPVLILLAAAILALFLPAASLHVHSQLGEETAALFPASISLWDVIAKGSSCLPTEQVPELKHLDLARLSLTAGVALLALSCLCALIPGKGFHISLLPACASAALLASAALQWMNVAGSLLFTVLFTVQAWLYVPMAAAIILIVVDVIFVRQEEPLFSDDRKMRLVSAALAALCLLSMLLPVYVIEAPATLTQDAAEARIVSRRVSLVSNMLGQEKNLYQIGQEQGVFSNVLTGDLKALEPYSGDGNNIQGIFLIRGNNATVNVLLVAGAALMLLTLILSLLPKADRWFPLACGALGAVLLSSGVLSVMTVGDGDMYASASRQLLHLGIGHITVMPLLTALLAVFSAVFAGLGVRYANEPYFVNPVPARLRIRLIAITLAALAAVCALLPNAAVTFTKPNKNKAQAIVTLSGAKGLLFSGDDLLRDPADSKGKAIYAENDEEYSAAAVNAATARLANTFSYLTWAALILTLAGLAMLALNKNRKVTILLFLAALAVRLVTWLSLSRGMPRAVGSCGGTLYLYASLPLLLFAAFFTNFTNLEELPKKYKLFLMTLPFLLAVFLFSYLPLYGWSYAFYNYKFGIPMDQQEFVGFKWFTEMFSNPANRDNIARVLKNTLGMSGMNLATSWMPMIFAVFLNEITRTRFKKFVQIFTTLPNFISWALVFSFAMCLFAADTGIYSKLMMDVGLNDPANPTVWLNSSQHIWLKMWGCSTWKGLGWGAIMYLAAIAGIDQELYEAARVDGANRWALIRHITLPSLLPTFFVLLMLSISNILNNGMDQYLVFQNPMNRQTIEVLDLYVYNITIASGGTALYSYATAIGILKTLVSVTLLFSANFLSKKLRGESIM